MVSAASEPSRKPHISRAALWFGVFGGLVAWALHFSIAYILVYNGCMLGANNLKLWIVVNTVVFGLITLAATGVAYQSWQRTQHIEQHENEDGVDYTRIQFMAMIGVWLSGLSFFTLLLGAIPILLLQVCG